VQPTARKPTQPSTARRRARNHGRETNEHHSHGVSSTVSLCDRPLCTASLGACKGQAEPFGGALPVTGLPLRGRPSAPVLAPGMPLPAAHRPVDDRRPSCPSPTPIRFANATRAHQSRPVGRSARSSAPTLGSQSSESSRGEKRGFCGVKRRDSRLSRGEKQTLLLARIKYLPTSYRA
jgi:hypothetical protein